MIVKVGPSKKEEGGGLKYSNDPHIVVNCWKNILKETLWR